MDLSPYFQQRLTDKVYAVCLTHEARLNIARPRVKFSEITALQCDRALWFGLNGIRPQAACDGPTARAAERGRLARQLVARDLRRAGYTVEWQGALECGYIYGLTRQPHLLDIEAVPERVFKRLEKFGLGAAIDLEIALHSRLGLAKMERALFVAENKNTQELHFEKVRFDPDIFQQMRERMGELKGLLQPPEGCFDENCFCCGFHEKCAGHSPGGASAQNGEPFCADV
jgi:hypothetical protein